jgi:23S rRNA pseudouridine1911/1915/1917 synthase
MKTTNICFYPKKIESGESALQRLGPFSKNKLKEFDLLKEDWLKLPVKGQELKLPVDLLHHNQIQISEQSAIQWLEETPSYFAFHKPPKMHSHPHAYSEVDNALSHLYRLNANFYDYFKLVNPSDYSRGLLYRLDFETSGLMVFIKDHKEHAYLRENYGKCVKKKGYVAIVQGQVKSNGKLVHWLIPSGPNKLKMKAYEEMLDGKSKYPPQRAELSYEVLSYDSSLNQSKLKIYLQSGHRHQIRVQLSHIGHAIVGDSLYGNAPQDAELLLQAKEYEWVSKAGSITSVIDPVDSF